MSTDTKLHVTFACTYNRARSVMAAAMFAHQLRERGLENLVRVSSAGTSDQAAGQCADGRAVEVLRQHGYPAPVAHRAALVGADHLGADLVVALSGEHLQILAPLLDDPGRLRALRSFDPAATTVDMKNPCWGTDFADVFELIDASLPGLHEWVISRLRTVGLDVMPGWRFWFLYREEVRMPFFTPRLIAPFQPSFQWVSAGVEAVCPHGQEVPHSDCVCGIYADHTAGQCMERILLWLSAFKTLAVLQGQGGDRSNLNDFPSAELAEPPVCVLGQCAMHGAVLCEPTAGPGLRVGGFADDYAEIRAAGAEMVQLFVIDGCDGVELADGTLAILGQRLAQQYGVPTFTVRWSPAVPLLEPDELDSAMARMQMVG